MNSITTGTQVTIWAGDYVMEIATVLFVNGDTLTVELRSGKVIDIDVTLVTVN